MFASLLPRAEPPLRGYRVVSGMVWWRLLHWPWRQYLAAIACGTPGVTPPQLASRLATGLYFTDQESLLGCGSPNDYANRLALHLPTRSECDLYGTVVIEFAVPRSGVALPPTSPGMPEPGLTAGGGREWVYQGNLALDRDMKVHCIERTINGYRHFEIYL